MNGATLLLRQINPAWVQDGRVTSQAFKPTPKDEGMLSVYNGDKITPYEAWVHFRCKLNNKSVGVMAVTQDECHTQGTSVKPDPTPFPEHVLIDFHALTKSRMKVVAKILAHHANKKGWQYGPVYMTDRLH